MAHQDKILERETFDRIAADAGGHDLLAEGAYRNLVAEFVRACAPVAGATVLEVGCGTGSFTRRWASLAVRVVGVDLSPVSVRAARRLGGGAGAFAVADAERLPFRAGAVDHVIFSSVLHHIPDFAPAVAEAHRVLRPGGHCFAFDPNVRSPVMFLLRHPSSPLYSPVGVSPQERPLAPARLRDVFQAAGFRVSQRARAALPYRTVGPAWARPLLGLYNGFDDLLERSGLGRAIGPFVITVGRKRPANADPVPSGATPDAR